MRSALTNFIDPARMASGLSSGSTLNLGLDARSALAVRPKQRKTRSGAKACDDFPFPGATLDIDWHDNRAYSSPTGFVDPLSLVTITADGPRTYFDENGILQTAATGVPRISSWGGEANNLCNPAYKGLFCHPAITNHLIWSRDLTQADWVKTDCTAALDQVGIDGAANSASSLTANAENATAYISVSGLNSSYYYFYGLWARRLSGSGAVHYTPNGGANWYGVTFNSSGYWELSEQYLTAVSTTSFGIRIVTSGDSIALDGVHAMHGYNAVPFCLFTAGSSATMVGDSVSIPASFASKILAPGKGTLFYAAPRATAFNNTGSPFGRAIAAGSAAAGTAAAGISVNDAASFILSANNVYPVIPVSAYTSRPAVTCVSYSPGRSRIYSMEGGKFVMGQHGVGSQGLAASPTDTIELAGTIRVPVRRMAYFPRELSPAECFNLCNRFAW